MNDTTTYFFTYFSCQSAFLQIKQCVGANDIDPGIGGQNTQNNVFSDFTACRDVFSSTAVHLPC